MITDKITTVDKIEKHQELSGMAKRSSHLARVRNAFANWLKEPDLTLARWERLESKIKPCAFREHSDHYQRLQ